MDRLFLSKLAFKSAMMLLVAGGLMWLFVAAFGYCVLGKGPVARVFYAIVGLAALAIMFDRDTYLPFLGPTVAPCSSFQDRTPPGATREVKVTVPALSKVIYWAAEPSAQGLEKILDWKEAYAKFENLGVTTANEAGVAVLKVREPQAYVVPLMGKINAHVHYRVCSPNGFMERVMIAYIGTDQVEGFESGLRF
jgi:hypothetical protein